MPRHRERRLAFTEHDARDADLLQVRALSTLDMDEPFPLAALRVSRGKGGRKQKVSLPEGYLECRDDDTPPDEWAGDVEELEGSLSGG